MKKKLLVVCGGQSSEHSISRISCNSVMKHLDKDKYEITLVGIAKDGKWYILKQEDNDLSKDTWQFYRAYYRPSVFHQRDIAFSLEF